MNGSSQPETVPPTCPHATESSLSSILREEECPRLDLAARESHSPSALMFWPRIPASSGAATQPATRTHELSSFRDFLSVLRPIATCSFCDGCSLRRLINVSMYAKYEGKTQRTYNVNVINDIMYNSPSHIVSLFKDYLIYDDRIEFLKFYYPGPEVKDRVSKLCEFYNQYTKVFPNYVALEEKKYMFRNIDRKQKLLDQRYKVRQPPSESPRHNRVLTTRFMEQLSQSRLLRRGAAGVRKLAGRLNMRDLLDRFLENDSLSLLRQTNCDSLEATFIPPIAANGAAGNVLCRAENARKKSAAAHQTVSSMAKSRQAIRQIQSPALTITKMVRKRRGGKAIPASPSSCSHAARGGKRALSPVSVPIPVLSVASPRSVRINFNIVLNKNNEKERSSRTATTQTATDGLRRYRSVGNDRNSVAGSPRSRKVVLLQDNTKPKPRQRASLSPRGLVGTQRVVASSKGRADDIKIIYSKRTHVASPSPGQRTTPGSPVNKAKAGTMSPRHVPNGGKQCPRVIGGKRRGSVVGPEHFDYRFIFANNKQ